MSHVDDGTLHAYLDGESTAVEREHLEAHLAGCAACRARLAEERVLIERAGRLLGLAAPPERAAPPFHELRRPRRGGGGYRLPLAWAATLALAVGIGWYSRGRFQTPVREQLQQKVAAETPLPAASAEPAAQAPSAPSGRVEPRRDRPTDAVRVRGSAPAADAVVTGAVQEMPRAEHPESTPAVAAAGAVARLEAETARPDLRNAVAPAPTAPAPIVLVDGRRLYDQSALHRMSTTWPVIEPQRARDLLGEDPAVIPGYAVRALRSNPAARSEIVVEQMVDSGLVLLFERRSDVTGFAAPAPRLAQGQAAGKANERQASERLARYIRSLRVEIAGSLSADSLSALLGLIR
jgi:putative zinc finger protein